MNLEDLKESLRKSRDLGLALLFEKYKVLPLIATLSVALLVLSSINPLLIKDFELFKISLKILILLIPISLFFFLASIYFEINSQIKEMKQMIETSYESEPEPETTIKGRLKKAYKEHKTIGVLKEILIMIMIHSSWLLTIILSIALVLFIYSI